MDGAKNTVRNLRFFYEF